MGRKFIFPYVDMSIFSLIAKVYNYFEKKAVCNVGCVSAYFCGGHKNKFLVFSP